jgi:hypothetical protein
MFFRTKSHFISWVILAVVMVLTAGHASDHETIQAQAFGTTTMSGKTFGVTITIEEYSTPADQKALIDAFNSGGHDAMVKVLSNMKSKGRVRLSSGGVGYQITYIRNIPTANGRTIRLLTDRPIGIGEAMFNTRSGDYDISIIEIQIGDSKGKNSGSLIPGARVLVNKKSKQIEIESYHSSPWRLAGIMER